MSLFKTFEGLLKEVAGITGEEVQVELTLPFKARIELMKDIIANRRGYSIPEDFNPNQSIDYRSVHGTLTVKPISEETRLRNEIKARKEHLEYLEKQLEELL